jgi:putative Holliday junction resolvase
MVHAFVPFEHRMPKPAPSVTKSGSAPERILALDYGRKRIGLAISDELGLTARPLSILERKNRRSDLATLRDICAKHGVTRILVGHPLHITGEAGEMADEAAAFAARIQKDLGLAVELADERLTSWEAGQTMVEAGHTSRSRRASKHLDDVAAAILLREYLDRHRDTALVPPDTDEIRPSSSAERVRR